MENTKISSLNSDEKNEKAMSKDLKKLASGLKIGSAADDASGYAISERMAVQIRGLDQDSQNTQNSQALMKTASGALDSTMDILKTLKEKAINAANDTNTDADRATIQKEFDQAIDQIDENANMTYNGQTLVDGSKNRAISQPGTRNSFANTSLYQGTTDYEFLTDLKDANGNNLGIVSTDTITVSYVKDGTTHTASQRVGDMGLDTMMSRLGMDTDMEMISPISDIVGTDADGNDVKTTNGLKALAFVSTGTGTAGQITGLTISFTDKDGQQKMNANALFNNFEETVAPEDPSEDNAIDLQVGTKANQTVRIGLKDIRSVALGLRSVDGRTISIGTQENANAAINVIDTALKRALDQQTDLGSVQSRLGYTSANIITASENTQSAESTIRDANMAQEMTAYTKNNIITQAAQSMLAQANQTSSVSSIL